MRSALIVGALGAIAVASAIARADDASCPEPTIRKDALSMLKDGADEDRVLAGLLGQVSSCQYSPYGGCAPKVDACKAELDHHAATMDQHDETVLLGDIEGGWLGQTYQPLDKTLDAPVDDTFNCDVTDTTALQKMIDGRNAIAAHHESVIAEWWRWYAWASALARGCASGSGSASASQVGTGTGTGTGAGSGTGSASGTPQVGTGVGSDDVVAAQTNQDITIAVTNAVDNGPSGGNAATGPGHYLHVTFGGAFPAVPIFVDNDHEVNPPLQPGDQAIRSSAEKAGAGMGVALDLAYWPWFAPSHGLGVSAMGSVAAIAAPNTVRFAALGGIDARGFLGSDAGLSLLADVGEVWRYGHYRETSSMLLFDGNGQGHTFSDSNVGTASYFATRFGGGLRVCYAKQEEDRRFCEASISLLALVEISPMSSTQMVYRAEFLGRRFVMLSAEVGFGYPAAGTPKYTVQSTTGTYMMFTIGKSFDHFSARRPAPPSPPPQQQQQPPPPGDRDGDGLTDDVDQCPDEPEDKDDFQDDDGCPDPAITAPPAAAR